ncbi:hypothetical protein [Rhodococcus sp. SJ-2]
MLTACASAAVDSWTVASWLSTEQPELDGRTPRLALAEGDIDAVVMLARQAAARLLA